MSDAEAVTGRCLCAAVSYRAALRSTELWFCHCQRCRKASAVAFASWIAVDCSDFQWLSGHDQVQQYASSDALQRCFCGTCGAVLPALDSARQQRWLPAGGLQPEPALHPRQHRYVASKAPWFDITDGLPCYAQGAQGADPVVATVTAAAAAPVAARGSCLCGAIAYRLQQPLEAMRCCHCSRCRRNSGSAFFVGLPGLAGQLVYERGESLLSSYKLPGSRFYDCRFCRHCGSTMPGRLPGVDRTVAAAGTLDEDVAERIRYHLFTADKAHWCTLDDGLPQFAGYPPQGFQADAG